MNRMNNNKHANIYFHFSFQAHSYEQKLTVDIFKQSITIWQKCDQCVCAVLVIYFLCFCFLYSYFVIRKWVQCESLDMITVLFSLSNHSYKRGSSRIVDLGSTKPLTSQVISVTFYNERKKSDKLCSEALISAWVSFTCRKSTTRDPRLYFPAKENHTQEFYDLKKFNWPRPGLNPRTSDPVASMITTRPLGSTQKGKNVRRVTIHMLQKLKIHNIEVLYDLRVCVTCRTKISKLPDPSEFAHAMVLVAVLHWNSYQGGIIEIVYGTMLQHVYFSLHTQQHISGHFTWKCQQHPCDDANISLFFHEDCWQGPVSIQNFPWH